MIKKKIKNKIKISNIKKTNQKIQIEKNNKKKKLKIKKDLEIYNKLKNL